MKKVLMTGDRPTGRLHLGHYVGSIQNRVKLQDEVDQAFYMVADVQALTDNADNPEKIRANVKEVILDNLACGVDPKKTVFFIQSEIPEIAELTVFFLNLVTVSHLFQNPTIKTEINERFFHKNIHSIFGESGIPKDINKDEYINTINISKQNTDIPAGFLTYPVSQSADILFCKANIVPVGEDQKPMIEQCNDIAHSFNRYYGDTFSKVSHLLSDTPRLIGTDGNSKMSKSLGNCIYLSDSREEIEQKVKSMYTDPNHIHVSDEGKVEGNVVFTYLDIFDKNKKELEDLKAHYRKGGLGDTVIKKRLTEILDEVISPIRERRKKYSDEDIKNIIISGNKEARRVGAETMKEVRNAMGINYFS